MSGELIGEPLFSWVSFFAIKSTRAVELIIEALARAVTREWRGVTHTVLVHADGVEWNGRRYRSLTVIAREITGAHWSGPRFFGLRKRVGSTSENAEGEHAQA